MYFNSIRCHLASPLFGSISLQNYSNKWLSALDCLKKFYVKLSLNNLLDFFTSFSKSNKIPLGSKKLWCNHYHLWKSKNHYQLTRMFDTWLGKNASKVWIVCEWLDLVFPWKSGRIHRKQIKINSMLPTYCPTQIVDLNCTKIPEEIL